MDKFCTTIIVRFRDYRTRKLKPVGELLLRIGVGANLLTFFSWLSGLAAVYFLFNRYYLFLLFALLHLLFDGIDGVVAQLQGSTTWGKYLDLGSDTLTSLLILSKVAWFVDDYFAYLIAGLFFLAALIHFLSHLEAPMVFIRTAGILALGIATAPLFPFATQLLTLGYLAAGVSSAYSLARQLQWFMVKRNFS